MCIYVNIRVESPRWRLTLGAALTDRPYEWAVAAVAAEAECGGGLGQVQGVSVGLAVEAVDQAA
ncbi:MAG: hypothetical protein OEW42_13645 [Acidimicrobiia bacterium]|nr:hypothetical protein [Acidimicrobiia bacterium]